MSILFGLLMVVLSPTIPKTQARMDDGAVDRDYIVSPDQSEYEREIFYPDKMGDYKFYTKGSEGTGTLIAGRSEFPYLLNLYMTEREQEDWAIGNLMSHKAVLTTCRWSTFFLRNTQETAIDYELAASKNKWRVNSPELIVFFAPLYLKVESWAQTLFWDMYKWRSRTGSRSVKFISTHPKCEIDEINYDFAVLTLSRGIAPVLPFVAYMPIWIDRTRLIISDFDLSTHENKRIVCYIASYGRKYINWKFHIALNYKVRYRVYYQDWNACAQHYTKYRCPKEEENHSPSKPGDNVTVHHCPGAIVSNFINEKRFNKGFENIMCFNSRSRIGAVCDHDNGAPLVCDGKVFGLVTRGAHYNYCNHLVQIPFMVIKISPAADYYMNLARKPFSFSLLVNPANILTKSFANTFKPSVLYLLLPVTVLLFIALF